MTKHDHKIRNISHRLILQLGNVQKKQYIIMNIMYTTYSPLLYERSTRKWKDKLFHEANSDLLSTCMDLLPTARYTESEVIEVMNYLLYVFISSVCMHCWYIYISYNTYFHTPIYYLSWGIYIVTCWLGNAIYSV